MIHVKNVFVLLWFALSMEEKAVPEECVLKVFKTTLNEFKNRDKYIKDDYRFKDRFSKLNPRKVIRLWAEKEMHNLARCVDLLSVYICTVENSIAVEWFIETIGTSRPILKHFKGGDFNH